MKIFDYTDFHFLRRNLRKHIRDAIIEGYPTRAIFKSIGLKKDNDDDRVIMETAERWWDEGNEKMAVLLLIAWHYCKKCGAVRIKYSKKAEMLFWEGIKPNSLAGLIRTNFNIGERN